MSQSKFAPSANSGLHQLLRLSIDQVSRSNFFLWNFVLLLLSWIMIWCNRSQEMTVAACVILQTNARIFWLWDTLIDMWYICTRAAEYEFYDNIRDHVHSPYEQFQLFVQMINMVCSFCHQHLVCYQLLFPDVTIKCSHRILLQQWLWTAGSGCITSNSKDPEETDFIFKVPRCH